MHHPKPVAVSLSTLFGQSARSAAFVHLPVNFVPPCLQHVHHLMNHLVLLHAAIALSASS